MFAIWHTLARWRAACGQLAAGVDLLLRRCQLGQPTLGRLSLHRQACVIDVQLVGSSLGHPVATVTLARSLPGLAGLCGRASLRDDAPFRWFSCSCWAGRTRQKKARPPFLFRLRLSPARPATDKVSETFETKKPPKKKLLHQLARLPACRIGSIFLASCAKLPSLPSAHCSLAQRALETALACNHWVGRIPRAQRCNNNP